jgi:hypothetical protein
VEVRGYGEAIRIDDHGVTFVRGPVMAAARGVGRDHDVPFSAIEGVDIQEPAGMANGRLRLRVAGREETQSASDPNMVNFTKRQLADMRNVAAIIAERAAGQHAVPEEAESAPAPAPTVEATVRPAPQAVTFPKDKNLLPLWYRWSYNMNMVSSGLALVLYLLVLLLIFGFIAWLFFAIVF